MRLVFRFTYLLTTTPRSTDLPEHVEYAPDSGPVSLFPDATLDMCEVPCSVDRVQSKISLQTSHIGKGCDRDTYSVENQRRLCSADAGAVDLLPSPSAETQWTRPLPRDHGHESDEVFQVGGVTDDFISPSSWWRCWRWNAAVVVGYILV